MDLMIYILAVLVFSVSVYGLFFSEINKTTKFDIIFLFLICSIFCARLIAILSNFSLFQVGWDFSPLIEQGDNILVFSTWPWIFLRLWDSQLSFEFPFLLLIFSFFTTISLFGRKIKEKTLLLNNIALSTLIVLSVVQILQLVLPNSLQIRDIGVYGVNSLVIQLVINILIFIILFGVKRYDKDIKYFPILFIFWALLNTSVRLIGGKYTIHLVGIDLYYFEFIVCFILSMAYFLLTSLRIKKTNKINSKQQVGIQRFNRVITTEKRRRNYERSAQRKNFQSPHKMLGSKISGVFKKTNTPRRSSDIN